MSYHRHVLAGCAPEPLAHYLKALGILRLVSEQKDETCRGAWLDDRFVLVTTLSREELEKFFLEEYKPTPIIDPWNGGSGFFPKDNKKGLQALLASQNPRLQNLKEVVLWAQKTTATWSEAPSDESKCGFQASCRAEWRSGAADALSAAVVLSPQIEKGRAILKATYPSLLGTGWNDGRLDFANNFHQRLADLLDLTRKRGKTAAKEAEQAASSHINTTEQLAIALSGHLGMGLQKDAIGQFLPNGVGGANSTTSSSGDGLVNSWDFVLMMEGSVLFSSAATKRMNPAAQAQSSAPFSLRSHSAGGGTLSEGEESARGEQWMPLWDHYLTLPELKNFLAEGRAQIGKMSVSRPVDMARAISRLGVARGITAFQRYGYLERNGQANFAVPLGRIAVTARPRARLIDESASWLDRLHRLARAKEAPSRLAHAERGLSDAVFAALTHEDSPVQWQAILRAAVDVEQLQSTGTAIKAGPIPKLSTEWLMACNDGSAEFRLAMALGSAAGGYSRDDGKPFNSIRHHWLPLEDGARQFKTSDKRLAHDVRVVAHGRDPETDLLAILERRTIESTQKGSRHPKILAAPATGACLPDLTAWIAGELDSAKCVELARAFMAVEWSKWDPRTLNITPHENGNLPEEAWSALRLNALPWPLDRERDIPFDPAIVRRLGAGDLAEAVRLALRRLSAHGIQSTIRFGLGDSTLARRWGSALAFPISSYTAHRMLHQLQPQPKETTDAR
jgi:CRISPR-associated protein Csx17